VYVYLRKSTSENFNSARSIDALSEKTVEISQQEVEVLAKDRQHLEQVPLFYSLKMKDLIVYERFNSFFPEYIEIM